MDNEQFKSRTRRFLALGIGGFFALIGGFVVVYGMIFGLDIANAGLTMVAGGLGTLIGFYFGRE